jgi:hypothetical protein
MKKNINFAVAFFLALTVFSCEEIETNHEPLDIDSSNASHIEFDPPKNINGILKFDTHEAVRYWSDKVTDMNLSEFGSWQEEIGFQSMDDLFNYLVDVENIASDSLSIAYSSTNILPKKIHSSLPIHSKKVIPHLDKLYFFEGGGFFPIASLFEPKILRLLNANSQIIIGEDLIEFKENGKFINKRKIESLDGANLATITSNSYVDRLDKIMGNYRTITDISYYVNEVNLPSGGGAKSASVSGNVQVRNFRKGLFGWNTRKTTNLRIQGNLNYHLYACNQDGGVVLPPPNFPYAHTNLNITSNGQNTTSITFNFTSPTTGIARTNIGCTSIPFGWLLGHQLIITGEGNNIANFDNY